VSYKKVKIDKRKREYKEEMERKRFEEEENGIIETASEPVPTQAQKPSKPATTPWKEQHNPWKRDILRLKKKHPGFRPRWVDPRNFERNLEDGWTFAKNEDYGGLHDKIAGEEKQIDSRIRRRGMVLMEIPEDLALQREAYYANRADMAEESIKARHKKEGKEIGVEAYEPKGT
jgi:hypothetical protein